MSSETQINVNVPTWLRRRMLHNLQKAAKDKVNRARAEVAANLYAAITKKPDAASSRAEVDPTTGKPSSDGVKAAGQIIRPTNSKVWRHIKSILSRALKRVQAFMKHKQSSRPAYSREDESNGENCLYSYVAGTG